MMMENYYSHSDMEYSDGLCELNTASLHLQPTSLPLQTIIQEGELRTDDLLSQSIIIANGMDVPILQDLAASSPEVITPSSNSGISSSDYTWSTANIPDTSARYQMPTPSPELSPPGLPPPYPYSTASWSTYSHPLATPTTSIAGNLSDHYLFGSSVDYSPLSSPGSADGMQVRKSQQIAGQTMAMSTSSHYSALCDNYYTMIPSSSYEPVMTNYSPTRSPALEEKNEFECTSMTPSSSYEPVTTNSPALEEKNECTSMIPSSSHEPITTNCSPARSPALEEKSELEYGQKEVKMPQRKGGIQLWQFLHYLLTNPEKKYRDIIEWTTNREFRMLEPESIAIWWGHHKNKPGMTYDKFSRSLRYYYDKGILKKIPGERYVYRFLIDPEVMYQHIGTSDCRPKVKPMPKAAKAALTKFHNIHSMDVKPQDLPRITQEAEPLVGDIGNFRTHVRSVSNADSWRIPQSSSNMLQVTCLENSASTGNLACQSDCNTIAVPMKRCKSLDITTQYGHPHLEHLNFPLTSGIDVISTELQMHSITTHVF